MVSHSQRNIKPYHDRLLQQATEHVAEILKRHWPKIMAGMDQKQIIASKKEAVKMHVAMGVDIAPRKGMAQVSAIIAYGVTTRDSTKSVSVSETPDLPMDGEK